MSRIMHYTYKWERNNDHKYAIIPVHGVYGKSFSWYTGHKNTIDLIHSDVNGNWCRFTKDWIQLLNTKV